MSYIEVTRYRSGTPVTIETTGICIEGISHDVRGRCTVNGIDVQEAYHEVIFRLQNADKFIYHQR